MLARNVYHHEVDAQQQVCPPGLAPSCCPSPNLQESVLTSMRSLLSSSMRLSMMPPKSLPLLSTACTKLTPSTPSASCCSWAVLSSIRVCIITELAGALHSSPCELVSQVTVSASPSSGDIVCSR